jgi:hypothetical protein
MNKPVEWDNVISKLNKLVNVKADAETGIVCMHKNDGIWHLLCAGNFFWHIFISEEFIVDYDSMQIGIVFCGEKHYGISYKSNSDNFTLKRERINMVNTDIYLGVYDEIENRYVEFPQITYEVNKMLYFDGNFNKIATGDELTCFPWVQSFYRAHIINDAYVLLSRETVRVEGRFIYVGEREYSFKQKINEEYGILTS